MKFKDLDQNKTPEGIKFIYPGDGGTYYFVSNWNKGVWAKKELTSNQIFPLMVEEIGEIFEWEVIV